MKTFVKFTGITETGALEAIPPGGAAGLIVEAPASPYNLSIEAASRLAEAVPSGAEVWAVTVSPPAELIHRLFDEMGVDRIQVYGAVPQGLEFLETHHIVPSLPIRAPGSEEPPPKVPRPEEHPILHLDLAGDPLATGSPGRPDWEVCRTLVEAHPGRKIVLCGGLTPETVAEGLLTVRPWGLDVSAGVDSQPGRKDVSRMRSLIAAVAQAESSLG